MSFTALFVPLVSMSSQLLTAVYLVSGPTRFLLNINLLRSGSFGSSIIFKSSFSTMCFLTGNQVVDSLASLALASSLLFTIGCPSSPRNELGAIFCFPSSDKTGFILIPSNSAPNTKPVSFDSLSVCTSCSGFWSCA